MQADYLHVFNHCEVTRHDRNISDRIFESIITTPKGSTFFSYQSKARTNSSLFGQLLLILA